LSAKEAREKEARDNSARTIAEQQALTVQRRTGGVEREAAEYRRKCLVFLEALKSGGSLQLGLVPFPVPPNFASHKWDTERVRAVVLHGVPAEQQTKVRATLEKKTHFEC
jgi:hypothetical protein